MALESGTRLGHYEITAQIGKGGMGEVYRARDTKLGREVAIKVLPSEFAQDSERLARLEREARMLAALNHPNIAAIYGLEQSDDTRFLVLELVEGDTLADKLRTGPIKVAEALKLALQIAEALEAAHEKGVIHRDLKPANIKITRDGRAKVLDFGLAKVFIGEQADVSLSNSPTLSMAATQAGVILGTAAYMSPEQAEGEAAEFGSDIWSFGVVLFEMLSGQQTFDGKTVPRVLAAVLNSEPDWNILPANLHPRVRALLDRLLEKDPKDRLSSISDARVEIQRILADPAGVVVLPEAAKDTRHSSWGWVAAIVLAGTVAGLGGWFLKPAPAPGVVRREHPFPDGLAFAGLGGRNAIAVSPDGRMVAYGTSGGLYLLSVDEFEARPVAGVEGQAVAPVFSPDGEWLAFFSQRDRQIRKVPVAGGAPVMVADVQQIPVGMTWSGDNSILFGQSGPAAILSVPAEGGTPETLFAPETLVAALSKPQQLPDGESLLFTMLPGTEIGLKRRGSDEVEVLFPGIGAQYLPTGHIVYGFDGALYAQRFDMDTLETVGGPVPMPDALGASGFSVHGGTLAWFAGVAGDATERTLVRVDREGNEETIGIDARRYEYLNISHDGRQVAVDEANESGGGGDIWVWNFESRNAIRLTRTPEQSEFYPVWTGDDRSIVFATTGGTGRTVYGKASNNTGAIEPLTGELGGGSEGVTPYFFSADGALVFREQAHPVTRDNIGMIALDGTTEPEWLLAEEFDERNAALSPDGNWMAYQSDESGRFEIYVRPFPNVHDNQLRISNSGGVKPLWGPDGELFFIQRGNPVQMMVADVVTGPTFSYELPRRLIDWPYDQFNDGRTYDIAPDGLWFLTTKPTDQADSDESEAASEAKVRIVLNWTQELLERVPVP